MPQTQLPHPTPARRLGTNGPLSLLSPHKQSVPAPALSLDLPTPTRPALAVFFRATLAGPGTLALFLSNFSLLSTPRTSKWVHASYPSS